MKLPMKNNLKWFFGTVILIGVICPIIAQATYDWSKNVPLLKYITSFFVSVYHAMINFFTYPLQLWIVLLGLGVLYFVYRIIRSTRTEDGTLDFLNYRHDVVKVWLWKWDWAINTQGKYQITNMIPYCPKDDVQLYRDNDYLLSCPQCGDKYHAGFGVVIEGEKYGEWEYVEKTRLILEGRARKFRMNE